MQVRLWKRGSEERKERDLFVVPHQQAPAYRTEDIGHQRKVRA
jgi:hypothetical protein